jgi:phospholipid N-methyltransferase
MYTIKGISRDPNVIEPIPGYSAEMMLRQCKLLAGIVNSTEEVKVGRGKKAFMKKVLKYTTEPRIAKSINDSVEFYKNLMEKRKPQIKLRDYQKKIATESSILLMQKGFVYLAMEVRTGKTLTSLSIAHLLNCKNVLFITKKKAISSIESDYIKIGHNYDLTVINYESLHKIEGEFDIVICDEAHGMGAFPKPSKRAKQVKDIIKKQKPYVVLLSGTPTPESYSQMYHQVYGIKGNPFADYANFYKFSKEYVNVKQRKINGLYINDYHDGKISIMDMMKPFTLSYSQKEAGFKVDTREHILEVDAEPITYKLTAQLKKDLVIEGKEEVILADTPVKLMMKLHQMYSGTVKFESGKSTILDLSKARFIHDNFGDVQIGIFYKFKEELNALKKVYGDSLCTELSVFEDTSKSIALQIVSGREGISLRKAEALVYYNIDFSATSYWQSRDRMTTKDRLESDVYWIFTKGGIEKDIYEAVSKKKDYTLSHFKRDLLSL